MGIDEGKKADIKGSMHSEKEGIKLYRFMSIPLSVKSSHPTHTAFPHILQQMPSDNTIHRWRVEKRGGLL